MAAFGEAAGGTLCPCSWGTVRCHRWHWGGTEGDEHGDSKACTQPAPQGCGRQPRAWLAALSSVPLNPVTPCRNASPAPQAPLGSPNPPRAHPHAPIPCLSCKSHPDREAPGAHLATDLLLGQEGQNPSAAAASGSASDAEWGWRKEITQPAAARKDLARAVLAPGRYLLTAPSPGSPSTEQ